MASLLIWPAIVAGAFLFIATWWSPDSRVARRSYQLVLAILTIRYAVWRWCDTLPIFHLDTQCFAMYGFFLLEAVSLVLFVRGRSVLASTLSRTTQANENTGWHEVLPRPPLIDVFVPTYNENWLVLEKTFVGLRCLRYPRMRIWILDDGRRDWLKIAAENAGFNYITRPDNKHFKAGNLNNALRQVMSMRERPDFITVFDADFVVQPVFLERTLALMADQKVAIVQTPQTFYNPDPFQLALTAESCWPDEQRYLFDTRMPSADAKGGALCCGTSFLLRVEALQAIGGEFPTDTICEDTMTSVQLRQKGWKTVYLMERLSAGLNAEGLEEFLKQRWRWCLGGVQIAQWSLRSARGFSKIYSIEAMLKWAYQSFMQLLWLTLPIAFWLTGFSGLHAMLAEILQYIVPMSIARSYSAWITRGTQMPLITDSMTLMLSPTAIRATLTGLLPNRQHAFRVTNKGLNRTGTIIHWDVVGASGTALLLLLGGMLYRTFEAQLINTDNYNFWNYYVAAQQSVVLLAVMLVGIERPRRRACDRYPTSERATLQSSRHSPVDAQLLDISLTGVRLRAPFDLKVGERIELTLDDVGRVHGSVVRRGRANEYAVALSLADSRTAMIQKIYCSRLCIPDKKWRAVPALIAVFATAGNLTYVLLRRAFSLDWSFDELPTLAESEADAE